MSFKISLKRIIWLSQAKVLRERIAKEFDSTDGKKLFDDKYMGDISVKRVDLEKMGTKLGLFNTVLVGALFVNIAISRADFSKPFLTAENIENLKEIILLVSASINVIAGIIAFQIRQIEITQEAWLNVNFKGDRKHLMNLKYRSLFGGFGTFRTILSEHQFRHKAPQFLFSTDRKSVV